MAEQQMKFMELKERLRPETFKDLVRGFGEALEERHDFEFTVRDQKCKVPADAISKAKLEVEYEIDEGEYEFQFKMKWR